MELENQDTQLKPPRKTSRFAVFFSLLSFLIALAAVAGAAYLWLGFKQTRAHLHHLQNQLMQTQDQFKSQQQTVAGLQTSVQQLNLSQEQKTRILAEAEYLTQLANFNLSFEGNIPLTLHLLQAADQQLANSSDATLVPIRQSLANQIAALNSVPPVDTAGLILRLNALSQQINQLPVIPTQLAKQLQNSTSTATPSASIWTRGMNSIKSALKDVVVVRHLQQPTEPLLPPQQQAYLVLNIQLQLSQAQWAVLHQQPTIYQNSLNQATTWIRQYFLQSAAITQSVLQALADLQKINVKPALPDISDTLTKIQNAMQQTKTTPANQEQSPS